MKNMLNGPIKKGTRKPVYVIVLLALLTFSINVKAQDATLQAVGETSICVGESATLEVIIGASINPYTVVYHDGVENHTVTNYNSDADPESPTYGGDAIVVSPTETTTYSLVSVTDQFNTALPISAATITIVVNPLPSAIVTTVNSGNPICYNTPFSITATATNGSTYELWNGTNTAKIADIPYTATLTANTNYTVRAISANGCITSEALPITLETIAPTLTGEGNKTINPNTNSCETVLPDYRTTVTVSDNCSLVENITLTQNPVVGSTISDHNTVQEVIITATDEAGNQNTYSFNVTLVDNQLPVVSCVSNQTVSTTTGCSYVHSGTAWNATASDNCVLGSTTYTLTGATTGTGSNLNGATFNSGTTTVTWTATDSAGLSSSCSFDVTVTDSENPVVNCVANQSVNTDSDACTYTHTGTTWNVSTSDNCSTPSVSYSLTGATINTVANSLNGVLFNLGVTTVNATVTDGSSNTASCSFTVTVGDAVNPVITGLPANITTNTPAGSCEAIVTWVAPSANDNCGVNTFVQTSSPTANLTSGSSFPLGSTTITYTATDANGNETIESFTVTINDNEVPVVSNCPSDLVQNATLGSCGAQVTFTTPTGSDNCSSVTVTQTSGLASGATFPVGVTTNTFQLTDASGNVSTCSFTVTINDTENPSILNLPSNISVNNDVNTCGAIVSWVEPTASDNCTGSNVSQTGGLSNGAYFPVGTSTITYTATDASGNTLVDSFTVTVNDTQLPEIVACPSNITKTTNSGTCEATVSWTEPSANDNCTETANITWTKSHTPGSTFTVGTTTVTYTATDEAGNVSANCSFNVTVQDREKPVVANCPPSIAQNVDAGLGTAVVNWTEPTATDNCTPVGTIVWTKSHTPGTAFPVGTTTVTYTATDESGNINDTCSFDVVITDNEAPTAVCAAPTISLDSSGLAILAAADVDGGSTDNYTAPENLVITLSKTTFNCSNIGNNTVTMTVKDAAGNTSSCQATIIIADTTAPTLTATSGTVNASLTTDSGLCGYLIKGSELDPIAADNCSNITLNYSVSGATTLSGSNTLSGQTLSVGTNTIRWTATDGTNTSTHLEFTITVGDSQSPSITTVGNQYKDNTPGVCGYVVSGSEFDASYSDNCSVSSITYSIGSGAPVAAATLNGVTIPTGINTITWTVNDGTNSRSSSFRVTVSDTENPTISPITTITEQISSGCGKLISWTEPTVSDNCPSVSMTQTAGLPNGSEFPVGTTGVTYTAVDAVGNTSTMSFNVIVNDLTPPVLTCPSGSSEASPFQRQAGAGVCFYTVVGTEFDPTTSDGCAYTDATNSFDGSTSLEGKELPVGTHIITWTAKDQSNNSSTCTVYVTVTDTQDPTFTQLNSNYSRNTDPGECFYTISDTFFDLRNLSDNCELQSPTYEITKNGITQFTGSNTLAGLQLPPDDTYPYSIVWTVSDVNGNTVVSTPFSISVSDNQAPSFECYGNEIRNIPTNGCTYTIVGNEFDPKNLVDNCDNTADLTISYTLDNVSGGVATSLANTVLAVGTHEVVWTVTDTNGNSASCNFNIAVVDSEKPTISLVSNQTRNAPAGSCAYVATGTEFDPVTVSDNCPAYTLTNNQSGTSTLNGFSFPVGITVVVWTVTDAGGNVATMEYQVEVVDTTAPDYTLAGDSSTTIAITKSADATNCYYTVLGNELDPQSITDNCTSANFAMLNNHNNYRSLAHETFPLGTTTISWSVTDNYGNATVKTLELTVVDDVKPVVSCASGPVTRVYDVGKEYYTIRSGEFNPYTSDNCGVSSIEYSISGATTASGISSVNGVQLNEGANTITWTVTDVNTNVETCSITVNVVSDLYPEIDCGNNRFVNTNSGVCTYTVQGTEFDPSSTTAGVTFLNNFNNAASLAGAVFPEGNTLVTWTAAHTIDGTEYTSSCTLYVYVSDNEAPSITAPNDIIINANAGCHATNVNLGTPITSDNCGVYTTWNYQWNTTYPIGTTTVTWYVDDIHGNRSSATQTVTVNDNNAPTFTCHPSICRQVDDGLAYYTVFDHEFNPQNIHDCSSVTVTNDFNNSNTLAGNNFRWG